ncbi:VOC family protein [Xinfangfangia pollutisoli]|uniref:VOC family protein n=1 Tax=Xinfangfangia pollutisoli TaxID=2865960 RepID=UPI001CD7404B|nr:VOC family protein [Xinfangfangia pollutisoli]
MTFDPYLHFQGNCRDAMQAYHQIFGGNLQMMSYAEAPDAPPDSAGSDRIMHATLLVEGRMLLGADFPPGMTGDPQQAVSVSFTAASVDTARQAFGRLAQGGAVIMEFAPTFWSDGFGMVKDRFGTHWMVSAPWRQG